MDNKSLLDKVAIVTGASSGIGAAAAYSFTKEGATVVIVGRNETKLISVAENCTKLGKSPLIIKADVTYDDDVKRIIASTINTFGKLDILVNNAGIAYSSAFLDEMAMKTYDKVISTNLRSAIYLTHLAASHLVKTKGSVVNISSIAGQCVVSQGIVAYSTSKAGLDHFTKSVALELASKGIRVNAISPGPVHTDILENSGLSNEDAAWEAMKKGTSLGRISGPDEIADMIVFLASDKGRGITGSVFVIDNGVMIRGSMESSPVAQNI